MDYKKSKAPTNTVTHNLMDFCNETGNIYESVVIMSKRANQIYQKMKEHPNSNDVRQEWNMLDALLSQMASKNNRNTPLHKPKDRYDLYGTYTGDTRG